MKSPLFKDNVEDREIRFKAPEEIDVVNDKTHIKNERHNIIGKEVNDGR